MLFQIQHDGKRTLWCGPAAIAAVTGHPTSVISQILREDRGHPTKGVFHGELFRAMRRLGYKWVKTVRPTVKKMTLARFAAEHKEDFATQPLIVALSSHYVVLAGNRFVDSGTKDPVWISSAPHRRSIVQEAWAYVKAGDADLPAPKRRDNSKAALRVKCNALAAKHGIDIEKDDMGSGGCWWVTCPALEHDDPHEGNHFAVSWSEVLSMVEDYVDCLTNGYLAAVTAAPAPPAPACPETTTAAVEFTLRQDGPDTTMGIACSLSLLHGRDITERQVRGAAMRLIRAGTARFWRKKLTLKSDTTPPELTNSARGT